MKQPLLSHLCRLKRTTDLIQNLVIHQQKLVPMMNIDHLAILAGVCFEECFATILEAYLKDDFCSISQEFYRVVILWWVDQKSSDFQQTFLLIASFRKLHCRVYCYFRVLVIKLIQRIFNEIKPQLRRPVFQQ